MVLFSEFIDVLRKQKVYFESYETKEQHSANLLYLPERQILVTNNSNPKLLTQYYSKLVVSFGCSSKILDFQKLETDFLLATGDEFYFRSCSHKRDKRQLRSFALILIEQLSPYSEIVRLSDGDAFFGAFREGLNSLKQIAKVRGKKNLRVDIYWYGKNGKIKLVDEINTDEENATKRVAPETNTLLKTKTAKRNPTKKFQEHFKVYDVWEVYNFSKASVVISSF